MTAKAPAHTIGKGIRLSVENWEYIAVRAKVGGCSMGDIVGQALDAMRERASNISAAPPHEHAK